MRASLPTLNPLQLVVVAPGTTTVRDLPSEVALGPGDELPKPCVANLDNLTLGM